MLSAMLSLLGESLLFTALPLDVIEEGEPGDVVELWPDSVVAEVELVELWSS